MMTSWAWYDDPKRLSFMLSRYKFVSKMLSGLKEQVESTKEELEKLDDPDNFTDEHGYELPDHMEDHDIVIPKDNIIKLLGTTKKVQLHSTL